ncbi:hypothetical protein AMJ86_03765 [bacterium SM23_57]|nr:MAG: hypothetical protein AMJ86_03765 [bacterium SM23_57]
MKNSRVFIGLGSNLGNREEHIYNALRLMHYLPTINVVGTSPIYETEPIGVEGHPDYLNMTAEIITTLQPEELLHALQSLEAELGRYSHGNLEPRTIDLDILIFGDQVVDADFLTIPHPRITERRYVLRTLLDIDANLHHPGTGLTIRHHFDTCKDTTRYTVFRK